MLNKELCDIFDIDEFEQYLIEELEHIENKLNNSSYTNDFKEELRAKYRYFKIALSDYVYIKKKKDNMQEIKKDASLSLEELALKRGLRREARRLSVSPEILLRVWCIEACVSKEEYEELRNKLFD